MPMNNNNSSQSIREDIIIKECPMTIVDKKGNKKKYTKKYVCKKNKLKN